MSASLKQLRSQRKRQRFVWVSLAILLAGAVASWIWVGIDAADWFSEKRARNLDRFLGEIRPWPIQQGEGWGAVWTWIAELWSSQGAKGVWNTFLIAVASATLAGVLAFVTVPMTSRRLAVPEPYSQDRHGSPLARFGWGFVRFGARALHMITRAIPEMILAFLLVAIFGFGAWAAVLALALHNAGVLGRLSSELVENADQEAAVGLRSQGAGRAQVFSFALFPEVLNRFLVFFFYRWETCVREATVLGLLGIVSLGSFIGEARARLRYDEMLFLIVLGAVLVVVGDLVSTWLRGRLNLPVEKW